MEPATIAAGVVALLAPYMKKAVEGFAGEAGKGAASLVQERAKALWQRLRAGFAGDAPAVETLDRFAADPDAHINAAEAQIAAKLAQDGLLRDELAAALAEIKRVAPQLRVVQEMQEAEAVVGLKAKRMNRGSAELIQKIGKAKGTTGAEFDEIG